jgi:hypothetical protein
MGAGVTPVPFKLRTERVEVGGHVIVVRELTHGERRRMVEAAAADRLAVPELVASFALVDPAVGVEDVAGLPAAIVDAAVSTALRLSGMDTDDAPEKKA